jgi:hypothetical protein
MYLSLRSRVVNVLFPDILTNHLLSHYRRVGSGFRNVQIVANVIRSIATMIYETLERCVDKNINTTLSEPEIGANKIISQCGPFNRKE